MFNNKSITALKRLHRRINGSKTEFDLAPYENLLAEIKSIESIYEKKSDAELRRVSRELSVRARSDEPLDDLLVETYALVREVVRRVLKLDPFDVQIVGGIVMHHGKLAEMQTGEGKTLTAVFPAVLNALTGKGVHVLTFNDYLALRDTRWMGPVYRFLGLKTSVVQERMQISERQNGYAADITYLTAKEAGFDYLRDSLCHQKSQRVHRAFHFAIVDEADSILIDEARIPLIIAGCTDVTVPDTFHMASIARELNLGLDVELDESARNVSLSDSGLEKVEKRLGCTNLYTEENIDSLARIHGAIHAEFLLKRDVDYIVRHGRIELVDELTGRVADNRRWPDGIQAALEAKERIAAQKSGKILNSITLRHFMRYYPKICGMTATAQPAEEELQQLYNLTIAVIPTHKPCIRIDRDDLVFETKSEKHKALVNEIKTVNRTGRPILVGTRSVEESSVLTEILRRQGIYSQVLNAKRDEFEASIVSRAGGLGAVTISTNMAGRGVDIYLGGNDEKEKREVMALGGLYVIGTNKHESGRIDKQLRGRAGRQGDPGSSRFFISLEDDLFVKHKIQNLISTKLFTTNSIGAIEDRLVGKETNRLQRIIEAQNLEIKTTLNKYSSIIEKQQRWIAEKRLSWLEDESAAAFFQVRSPQRFYENRSTLGDDKLKRLCRQILTGLVDGYWSSYLSDMAEIREGIHLRGYARYAIAGQTPHLEFQKIAIKLFEEMWDNLEAETVTLFDELLPNEDIIDKANQKLKKPSSTWTYLINDDPFDRMSVLGGNITMAFAVSWFGPVIAVILLYKRLKRWFS